MKKTCPNPVHCGRPYSCLTSLILVSATLAKSWWLVAAMPALVSALHAQTIPNAGFESWIQVGNYEEPVGWQTNNIEHQSDPPVMKNDWVVTQGTYGILVRSACASFEFYSCPGYAKTVLPLGGVIPERLYAKGVCNTSYSVPGYCEVEINLRSGGQIISSTVTAVDTTHCYTPSCIPTLPSLMRQLEIPVNPQGIAQADSLEIVLRSIPIPAPDNTGGGAAYFFLDELSFELSTSSSTEHPGKSGVELWPNPVREVLYGINLLPFELECAAYDLTGRLLAKAGQFPPGAFSINMGDFPAGMYVLRFQSRAGDWQQVERVIKH